MWRENASVLPTRIPAELLRRRPLRMCELCEQLHVSGHDLRYDSRYEIACNLISWVISVFESSEAWKYLGHSRNDNSTERRRKHLYIVTKTVCSLSPLSKLRNTSMIVRTLVPRLGDSDASFGAMHSVDARPLLRDNMIKWVALRPAVQELCKPSKF